MTARAPSAASRETGPAGNSGPLVFLIAGEPSGDLLGARLMVALRERYSGQVRFAGVGGAAMAEQGLKSVVPISDLAVMGLLEVVPHIPRIVGHIRRTLAKIRALRPAILITIDAPNFSLAIAKRLTGEGIALVHYVAPSVWAWKPGRAKRMAGYLDHLLTLLPFEPPYFERHGLATTFVGHPAIEAAGAGGDPAAFRDRHGIPESAKIVCILPGSRHGEVTRLLPIFGAALQRLAARYPDLWLVVPTVPTVAGKVGEVVGTWPFPVTVLPGTSAKYDAFAAAEVALAASGTVAVELAVAGVPSVIAYRLAPLTGVFASLLLKIRYVSLPNILLDREVQQELLQRDCTPGNIALALERLLDNPAVREAQRQGVRDAVAQLRAGEENPSQRAARQIEALIESGTSARNN